MLYQTLDRTHSQDDAHRAENNLRWTLDRTLLDIVLYRTEC